MSAGLAARLSIERNLWLCTVRPDGSPHVTPIWFVWYDAAFWCCTMSDAVKTRNLTLDPRLSVALEDGTDPVVAEGRAKLHARPYPQPLVERFGTKYDWDITQPDADGDWATLIEIRVDRWLMGGPGSAD
jgi:F420H(2)-dependent biliverdin reductase